MTNRTSPTFQRIHLLQRVRGSELTIIWNMRVRCKKSLAKLNDVEVRCTWYTWLFFFSMHAVDGGWSNWENWSTCKPYNGSSSNCGHGVRARQRRCDNPAPNGGSNCIGSKIEENSCHILCGKWQAKGKWCFFNFPQKFVKLPNHGHQFYWATVARSSSEICRAYTENQPCKRCDYIYKPALTFMRCGNL